MIQIGKLYEVLILVILVTLISSACNHGSDIQIDENSDTTLDVLIEDSTKRVKITAVLHPIFNVQKFVLLTDSFLSELEGKPIKLNFQTDTLLKDTSVFQSFYSALFTSNKAQITRYTFDPPKRSKALRFWYIEAVYGDKLATNEAFEKLIRQSGKVEIEKDNLPGLTYTNDFVIKAENKILWLNTGCAYSFANHKKMKEIMMHSLPTINIQDSIWCRCGQVECSFEN